MANIKSNAKRAITNKKKNEYYTSFKSSVKTSIKKFELAVEAGNKAEATELLSHTYKKLDKAITKGVFHKNAAARQKARLAKKLNTL